MSACPHIVQDAEGTAYCDLAESQGRELERLRGLIREAIADLDDEHRPQWYSAEVKAKGYDPIGCVICFPEDGSWPCVGGMIADDLRAALGDRWPREDQ